MSLIKTLGNSNWGQRRWSLGGAWGSPLDVGTPLPTLFLGCGEGLVSAGNPPCLREERIWIPASLTPSAGWSVCLRLLGVGGGRGEGRVQGRTYLPLESFKDQTQCYVCVVLPTSINIHREGICCFPEEIQASPLARPHGAALPSPPSALSAAAPASEVPPCSSERTAAVP